MARLSRWLEASGLAVAELSGARVEEFLAVQRRAGGCRRSVVTSGPAVSAGGAARAGGAGGRGAGAGGLADGALLASFERYLLAERGLAAGTVRGYVRHARRFVAGLGARRAGASVTAGEVTAAVLRESAAVSVSATQYFVAGLRAFLRFCFVEGLVELDLSQAALSVTGRRRSSLPKGIARADAGRCWLIVIGARRSGGATTRSSSRCCGSGLRRGEVARLTLEDIDWRAGELVVRGQGRAADRLPLPADVGEAIAAYLRRGRPASDRREVFLRARAPFGPIAAGTVSSTVRRACRRAGIAEVGSHRLRHTAACEMVAAEVPLVEIAQVLRHRSLQTTAIYARVDLERLRLLAAPWPGGAIQR